MSLTLRSVLLSGAVLEIILGAIVGPQILGLAHPDVVPCAAWPADSECRCQLGYLWRRRPLCWVCPVCDGPPAGASPHHACALHDVDRFIDSDAAGFQTRRPALWSYGTRSLRRRGRKTALYSADLVAHQSGMKSQALVMAAFAAQSFPH
jgi:hypothetical protein